MYRVKDVVTGFLQNSGKILILLRSDKVGSYQGRWAGVSGYVEKENSPEEQIYIEILEETNLTKDDIEIIKRGKPIEVVDTDMKVAWIIHPFLFKVDEPEKIKIDWEHIDYRWIEPDELKGYETVPYLNDTLLEVL